jgi:hypothetical protein
MRASLDELAQAMALRVSKQTLYADALLALSGWLDAASSEVHALRHATRRMPPTGALCARERWQPRAGGAPMSQARWARNTTCVPKRSGVTQLRALARVMRQP